MPGAPSADQPVPSPQESVSVKSAGKSAESRKPIKAKAQELLNRFTGWMYRQPPNPDAAIQAISSTQLTKMEPKPQKTVEETSQQAEIVEQPLTELQSEKIAKVRRLTGLPEKSGILDAEEIRRERRKLVDEYVEKVSTQFRAEDSFFGGGLISKGQVSKKMTLERASSARRTTTDKVNRLLTIQTMKLKGLKNAEEVIALLEAKDLDQYPELRDGKIIDNLKTINSEELNIGMDRLMNFGYSFYPSGLKSPQVVEIIKAISQLPEEQYQKACDELSPYFFLEPDSYGQIMDSKDTLNDDFKALTNFVRSGGLTGEQKQKLEQAKREEILAGGLLIPHKGEYLPAVVSLRDVFNNYEDSSHEDILSILEDSIYRGLKNEKAISGQEQVARNLLSLPADSIASLTGLVKKGVDCSSYYKTLWYSSGDVIPAVQKNLKDAVEFTSNQDELAWATLSQEILGEETVSITPEQLDFYRQVYEKREVLTDLAIIVKSLPKELNLSLKSIVKKEAQQVYDEERKVYLENARLVIDTDSLAEALVKRYEGLSSEDQDYLNRIKGAFTKTVAHNSHAYSYTTQALQEEKFSLLVYIAENKDRIDDLMTDYGGAKGKLIEEALEGKMEVSPEVINELYGRGNHNGISPQLVLKNFDIFTVTNQSSAVYSITREEIESSSFLTEKNREFLLKVKEYTVVSLSAVEYLLKEHGQFHDFFVNGKPTPMLLRRLILLKEDFVTNYVDSLLTDDFLATFSQEEKVFWSFYRGQLADFKDYICGVENFNERYVDSKNGNSEVNKERLTGDFAKEMIATPEKIGTWETLTQVFNSLGKIDDSTTRANMNLRIAEALSVRTLTARTEVEALKQMQEAFSGLYRQGMTDFEKITWNILKKQLPFATDEKLREDMRNKAVDVERVDSSHLSWVHQAIHNYVRAQNPDYIRALRDYVQDGNEENADRLRKFADFYTPDSKPGNDFYYPEVRQSLQKALPEIEHLLSLTESFFEIKPEKMTTMVKDNQQILQQLGLLDDLREMEKSLIEGAQEQKDPHAYITFLTKTSDVRERILKSAVETSYTNDFKNELLSWDTVVSGLYKGALTEYLNLYLEPKIQNHTLTPDDTKELLMVLKSTIISGRLEGEINGFTRSLRSIDDILTTFEKPDQVSIKSLELLLEIDRHEMNQDWSNFLNLAQGEMADILKGMGWTEADAKARVVMEDMVQFEKNSYKFALEPLLKTTMDVLGEEYPGSITAELKTANTAYAEILKGKILETKGPTNPLVVEFLDSFTAKSMPSNLDDANKFLTQIVSSPEAQADKLCLLLIKNYKNSTTGQRKYVTTKFGEDQIELYPFSYYGVDGVVMLVNGAKVNNPLEEIEKIYKKDIVPAIMHSLREGD